MTNNCQKYAPIIIQETHEFAMKNIRQYLPVGKTKGHLPTILCSFLIYN